MVAVPVLVVWLIRAVGSSLDKPVNTAGLLDDSQNQVELIFFGFVGCESVCPSALVRIGDAMALIQSNYPSASVGALFADINYFREYNLADEYSTRIAYATTGVRGINLSKEQVYNVSSHFNLRIVNNGTALNDIQHTDHLFVLRRTEDNWILDAILPTGTSAKLIADALKNAHFRSDIPLQESISIHTTP